MARQSFISHTVNGYSRYDVPESKAFTCTPGILYPVRIEFINARDRVTIAQGIDVRSNPLAVPTFNPYTVRLHRFWVPMQLYHPEMRTNSSKFDMNDVSLNWIPIVWASTSEETNVTSEHFSYPNSLLYWLRASMGYNQFVSNDGWASSVSLATNAHSARWVNADTYLAYWDIVRNYYGYSQWSLYSIAWPGAWFIHRDESDNSMYWVAGPTASYFTQRFCNLQYLDAFFESQFYPSAVPSTNNTYNRFNLAAQIVYSDLVDAGAASGDGYPVASLDALNEEFNSVPTSQISNSFATTTVAYKFRSAVTLAHPMAVAPSNPDRFSRMMPISSGDSVSMTGITTIPQLAIASRMQEYKDLLGAGGNRYSDWLETFFASKIEHVDRPKLLFSASQTVNVQVVMNQAGVNNFQEGGNPLGQQGGAIAFNAQLGRPQSYYFKEPGYVIDILSIRPVYYWSEIRPDYLNYQGADYFNPIYNDIGYQDIPDYRFQRYSIATGSTPSTVSLEPCYNEFRSSYDEVLGMLAAKSGPNIPMTLYNYWVQQRSFNTTSRTGSFLTYPYLFVDMSQVNSPFISKVEDNFFVNLSYSVRKKNLINKTFATRLSNR